MCSKLLAFLTHPTSVIINQNFGLLCFWQYLVLTKRVVVIEHKFPEVGHNFLDSDRDFAKIETAVRKRENIYTVDEYQTIMMNAFRKKT